MFRNIIYNNKYLLRLILLWLIIFNLYRIVFLIKYSSYLEGESVFDILSVFFAGFRVDLSAVGYLLVIPSVLFSITRFFQSERLNKWIGRSLFFINFLLALLYLMSCGGELGTYGEWEGKLSAKVLTHLVNPSEVFATASTADIIFFTMFLSTFMFVYVFIYVKYVNKVLFQIKELSYFMRSLSFLILGVIIFFFIRGGFQAVPLQLSNAYYSSNQFLNDVSVNTLWSFGNSIDKSRKGNEKNPFEMMPKDEADKVVMELFVQEQNKAHQVLKTERPNIAFIILESWTADIIESLGGFEGITPNFQQLTESGLLFENFYGAGWTSDQAMAAMFSSAVVFPNYSIINDPEAFRKLPAITDNLHKLGYNSSYFFGGDLDYGNIKAYLIVKGFQKIKDEDVYDADYPRGKLGVQDQYMFNQYINEINQLQEPFFTNLFTLSSHSPYDFPGGHPIDWGGDEQNYLNSIHYTDSCLGVFFNRVKKEPWYKNTLFVVVADHSHVSPKKRNVASRYKAHVPLLFFGEVLKDQYKGKRITKMGNHLDIPQTLLYQLGVETTDYRFGKNLLDTTTTGFASYTFHNGFGWVNPNGFFGYTFNSNKIYCRTDSITPFQEERNKQGMAFFQVAFEHFY